MRGTGHGLAERSKGPRVGKQDVNVLLIDVDHFRSPAEAQLSDNSEEHAMR